jgi:hypothetical protein
MTPDATASNSEGERLPVASRYFVAKHVPDLLRYEPRNVGVVLWTPSGTWARFLGEDDYGHLDSRRLPAFVGDPHTFREWIIYWRGLIQTGKGLSEILGPLESLTFHDEPRIKQSLIERASKAHWILTPGAVFMDPIHRGTEAELVKRLFSDLVNTNDAPAQDLEPVEKVARNLVRTLGLRKRPHFKEDFLVKIPEKEYEFIVDYAFVGKRIERLWQTLPTMPHRRQLETYAESTAFRFEQVHETYQLEAYKMYVLIAMTHEQEKRHKRAIAMVGDYAQVHNLADSEARMAVFIDLPKLDGLEGTPLGDQG